MFFVNWYHQFLIFSWSAKDHLKASCKPGEQYRLLVDSVCMIIQLLQFSMYFLHFSDLYSELVWIYLPSLGMVCWSVNKTWSLPFLSQKDHEAIISNQVLVMFYTMPWILVMFYTMPWILFMFYTMPWILFMFYTMPWILFMFYTMPWILFMFYAMPWILFMFYAMPWIKRNTHSFTYLVQHHLRKGIQNN